jgi:hypothetical protein
MDITFNFVHFTGGTTCAELSAETIGKIYTYRWNSCGDIQTLVNLRAVDVLPVTSSTRLLSQTFDKVYAKLTRMLIIDNTTEEYKKLFWEVKSILKS